MQYLTTSGQWAVQVVQCSTFPPRGSEQGKSYNALPQCLGALGGATPAMQCLTARGQRAAQLLQSTTSLPRGSG